MYDNDQSQTIQVPGAVEAETEMIMLIFQLGEMVELFGTLYLNEGLEMDAAVERANAIFSALDINNDGDVTEEEFVRGCMEVRILVTIYRIPEAVSSRYSPPRTRTWCAR